MSPTIRSDPDRLSGGYAILEGEGLTGIPALIVENVSSGLFLSEGGRWGKLPHPFTVEAAGQALRLGPAIVDHVPEGLLIALRSSDGRALGRLFWLDVMPSRGRRVVALASEPAAPPIAEALSPQKFPAPETPPTTETLPAPGSPAEVSNPAQEPSPFYVYPARTAEPSRANRHALPAAALAATAVVVLLAAGGAFALLRAPATTPAPAPVQDQARRCAESFATKVEATRAGSDDERVKTAEAALVGGCGAQALAALDGVDWEMNEGAAWRLARFYDPNETNSTVRAAGSKHPDWAATYYAHWASRAPRAAAALRLLCTTDAASLDANAQLRRACGR